MKYLVKFSKIILYIILGGMLAIIVCSVSIYIKANSIASQMANQYLLIVSTEGCSNYQTKQSFYNSFYQMYHSAYYMTDGCDDVRKNHKEHGMLSSTDNLKVKDKNNSSLDNAYNRDYVKHVQRGETITVEAKIYYRLYLPFVFTNKSKGDMTANPGAFSSSNGTRFSVTKTATGVSSKFFKGEQS